MLLGGDIERIKEELQPLFTDVKNTVSSIQNLVNSLPRSSIKRIQRGYFSGGSRYGNNAPIPISTVNVAKSILIIDRHTAASTNNIGKGKVTLESNSIMLTVSQDDLQLIDPFYWQIIEFN